MASFRVCILVFALALQCREIVSESDPAANAESEDLVASESQYPSARRSSNHYSSGSQEYYHHDPRPQQPRQYHVGPQHQPSSVSYSQTYYKPPGHKEPGYSSAFRKDYYDPRATCSTHFGQSGTCKPLVSCSIHYTDLMKALQTPCYLSDGMVGVCCEDQSK
jgi:hypothetical protein